MKINKRTNTITIGAVIFILLCVIGIIFVMNSNKKSDVIEEVKSADNSELYMIRTGTTVNGSIKYGFMDENGQIVIEPKYKLVSSFSDGVAYVPNVKDDGNWDDGYLMDKNENKICTVKGSVMGPYDGFCFIQVDGKMGAIDKTGKWTIKPKFRIVNSFYEGLFTVQSNEKWGYMDMDGKWLIRPYFEYVQPFSEGLAAVQKYGRCGYIDRTKKWIIKPVYNDALSFAEGLAQVKINEKWGYIDKNGEMIINPIFDETSVFKYGHAIVGMFDINNNIKYGIIDKKGEYIVEPKYDMIYIGGLEKDGFVFYNEGLYGTLDFNGDVIIESDFTYFTPQFNNKLFMDKDTVYFVDNNFKIKNKYKLGKMYCSNLDGKHVFIMTKDGTWYFTQDGELISHIEEDLSKEFELIGEGNN